MKNYCFKNNESSLGFTLIETLIVIFIISFFSVASVLGYSGYKQKVNLRLAAQEVYSDVRNTQSLAIATRRHNGIVPAGGYGLKFVKGSTDYIIFADDNNDKTYSGSSEKIEEKDLPSGIEISEIKISSTSASPVDIVFSPPKPTVYINTSSTDSSSTITLRIKGKSCPEGCKSVKISTSGVVETD